MSDEVHVPHTEEIMEKLEEKVQASGHSGGRFHSTLLTLAACGTIIGGLLAAYELYIRVTHREGQKKEVTQNDKSAARTDGWRTLSIQGGASIDVPQKWDIIERDAMQAVAGGLSQDFDRMMDMAKDMDCLQFLGMTSPPPDNGPRPFAMVMAKTFPDPVIEGEMLDSLSHREGCTLAKTVEMPNGHAVHCVLRLMTSVPDQPPIPYTQDLYLWVNGNKVWFIYFSIVDDGYLDNSGTFFKIAGSLKRP